MRTEHYETLLSNRDSRDDWEAKGSKTTWERAADKVEELIAKHDYSLPQTTRDQVLAEIVGVVQ